MGNSISKRLAAIVLATTICAGVTVDSAYAAETKNTKEQIKQDMPKINVLIIPLKMQITEEESKNILPMVVKEIEKTNNVKIKSYEGKVIYQKDNKAIVNIKATSTDGREGKGVVNVSIAKEIVIKFPESVTVKRHQLIITAVKDEVKKLNNEEDIKTVIVLVKHRGDETYAHVKVRDKNGKLTEKDIPVIVDRSSEVENKAPKIIAMDRIVKLGDTFDPLKGVMALDKEDGNLTDKIQVTKNTVDTSKVGKYKVEYKVTDSQGESAVKTISVTVLKNWEGINSKPVITASDKTLKVGDKYNPLDGVTASDKEDGDLTAKIVVVKNNVDTSKAGSYGVQYKVTDSMGASTTKDITVTVEKKQQSGNAGNVNNNIPSNITGSGLSALNSYNLPKTGGIGATALSGLAISSMLVGAFIKKKKKK
ncbi:MAG: DUF5011 domain-containing protein [Inconstantimicrobium porci]|uniref:immunoglobulin-like domain-containing protein n=1 Tax=Inconstantimicrobium porci TaxID=2652291 RepID=UPI002A91F6B9|nr:immunoglobulin-like domain-containing protein [Inconstantimicrobium porci]MDY5913400.1 DUF5011 domain-containing protein [Inconstantimicrobium porci]